MIEMRLDKLIEDKGLRKGYIAKQLEINANTLSNWINNKSFPRLDQAVQLAELLNCTVDNLYIKK